MRFGLSQRAGEFQRLFHFLVRRELQSQLSSARLKSGGVIYFRSAANIAISFYCEANLIAKHFHVFHSLRALPFDGIEDRQAELFSGVGEILKNIHLNCERARFCSKIRGDQKSQAVKGR